MFNQYAEAEDKFATNVLNIMRCREMATEHNLTDVEHMRMSFESTSLLGSMYKDVLELFMFQFSLSAYFHANMAWSSQAPPHGFGTEDRTEGVMKHIESEIEEVRRAKPGSYERLEELCDILILAMDAVWRGGYSYRGMVQTLLMKQRKNFGRTWPARPAHEASFHNRDVNEEPKVEAEQPELHHNFETHYSSWRGLLVNAISYWEIKRKERGSEEETTANLLYARHELAAFDDAYTPDGKPRFEKPSEQE